jgi:hypothetical protein
MPLNIVNADLYADRTVQDWHRVTMPHDADAIDVDLMGVCPVKWCRDPVYVIEATTNPNKPATILRRLAEKAGMVGIVVYHNTETITGHKVVFDPFNLKVSQEPAHSHSERLHFRLAVIRAYHHVSVHPDS